SSKDDLVDSSTPRTVAHGRSAYRIVWTSCSIVGDSSLSASRIIRLIGSRAHGRSLASVRGPLPFLFLPEASTNAHAVPWPAGVPSQTATIASAFRNAERLA